MKLPFRQQGAFLSKYLRLQSFSFLLLGILLIISNGLVLLNPQILRYFIDTAVAGGALEALFNAALLFIAVTILSQGLQIVNTYVSENVAWTATNKLRFDLVAHCLKLDQSFHKAHTPGELIERVDGDVNILSNFFSKFTIHILGNLILVTGILILLFREDWRLGLGVLAFNILGFYSLIRFHTLAVPYWNEVRDRSASFFGFLAERLAGIEDLKTSNAQVYTMYRFYQLMQRWFPVQIKANLGTFSMWMVTIGVFGLGTAVAFGLSAYLWQAKVITIGGVYLIFNYIWLLQRPFEQIRDELADLQKAEASIDRIETLFKTQSILKGGDGVTLPAGPLAVTFQDVCFGYNEQEAILQNVSFQLQPGRVLGLLGRTGSGKTTLIRLILRLYDLDRGEIWLNETPISMVELSHLRQRVGIVTQDVQLFQGTIRDNLTFFNPAISDEYIATILNNLGLFEWIQSFPAKLDTKLETDGGGLSAGQAQLLAFTRIFLSNPGLVILDEASSRLDPSTERLISQAIQKLLQNRTGIIIAHRLKTISQVDDLMIIKDGHILEYGDRLHLEHTSTSHFYQLLQRGLEAELA